jgi:hypothetical protein
MDKIELDFGALTIDNSTFKGEGYKFYEGLLAQLNQFKDGPVRVLQTDIVHNEAVKHIGQEISKARSSIENSLRSASKQLKISNDKIEDARELLSIEGEGNDIAKTRLKEYYEYIGAELIDSAEYIDFKELMHSYFSTNAPFEEGKDKKHEFPDAIALLSLDRWAEENDMNILAVSQDKGWKNYSDGSQRITLVSSLAEALEKFQPHNKVLSIIAHIRDASLLAENNHILDEIENAVANSVGDSDLIIIEADSFLHFEWDDILVSYISHELDSDDDGLVKVRIIRIDDKSIILKVGAEVEVEVEANFSFSIRDSIDKDYVGIGSSVCSTPEIYHTDILLTLSGDFSQNFDDLEVTEVEVLESIRKINFGDIAPDFDREYVSYD